MARLAHASRHYRPRAPPAPERVARRGRAPAGAGGDRPRRADAPRARGARPHPGSAPAPGGAGRRCPGGAPGRRPAGRGRLRARGAVAPGRGAARRGRGRGLQHGGRDVPVDGAACTRALADQWALAVAPLEREPRLPRGAHAGRGQRPWPARAPPGRRRLPGASGGPRRRPGRVAERARSSAQATARRPRRGSRGCRGGPRRGGVGSRARLQLPPPAALPCARPRAEARRDPALRDVHDGTGEVPSPDEPRPPPRAG